MDPTALASWLRGLHDSGALADCTLSCVQGGKPVGVIAAHRAVLAQSAFFSALLAWSEEPPGGNSTQAAAPAGSAALPGPGARTALATSASAAGAGASGGVEDVDPGSPRLPSGNILPSSSLASFLAAPGPASTSILPSSSPPPPLSITPLDFVIDLGDGSQLTPQALRTLVGYLYGKSPHIADDLVVPLLNASSYFDVPGLGSATADWAFHHLSLHNVLRFLAPVHAREYGEAGKLIEDASLAFAHRNAVEIGGEALGTLLPLPLLAKILVAQELWVPTEFSRYQLASAAKRAAIRRVLEDMCAAGALSPSLVQGAGGDRGGGGEANGTSSSGEEEGVTEARAHVTRSNGTRKRRIVDDGEEEEEERQAAGQTHSPSSFIHRAHRAHHPGGSGAYRVSPPPTGLDKDSALPSASSSSSSTSSSSFGLASGEGEGTVSFPPTFQPLAPAVWRHGGAAAPSGASSSSSQEDEERLGPLPSLPTSVPGAPTATASSTAAPAAPGAGGLPKQGPPSTLPGRLLLPSSLSGAGARGRGSASYPFPTLRQADSGRARPDSGGSGFFAPGGGRRRGGHGSAPPQRAGEGETWGLDDSASNGSSGRGMSDDGDGSSSGDDQSSAGGGSGASPLWTTSVASHERLFYVEDEDEEGSSGNGVGETGQRPPLTAFAAPPPALAEAATPPTLVAPTRRPRIVVTDAPEGASSSSSSASSSGPASSSRWGPSLLFSASASAATTHSVSLALGEGGGGGRRAGGVAPPRVHLQPIQLQPAQEGTGSSNGSGGGDGHRRLGHATSGGGSSQRQQQHQQLLPPHHRGWPRPTPDLGPSPAPLPVLGVGGSSSARAPLPSTAGAGSGGGSSSGGHPLMFSNPLFGRPLVGAGSGVSSTSEGGGGSSSRAAPLGGPQSLLPPLPLLPRGSSTGAHPAPRPSFLEPLWQQAHQRYNAQAQTSGGTTASSSGFSVYYTHIPTATATGSSSGEGGDVDGRRAGGGEGSSAEQRLLPPLQRAQRVVWMQLDRHWTGSPPPQLAGTAAAPPPPPAHTGAAAPSAASSSSASSASSTTPSRPGQRAYSHLPPAAVLGLGGGNTNPAAPGVGVSSAPQLLGNRPHSHALLPHGIGASVSSTGSTTTPPTVASLLAQAASAVAAGVSLPAAMADDGSSEGSGGEGLAAASPPPPPPPPPPSPLAVPASPSASDAVGEGGGGHSHPPPRPQGAGFSGGGNGNGSGWWMLQAPDMRPTFVQPAVSSGSSRGGGSETGGMSAPSRPQPSAPPHGRPRAGAIDPVLVEQPAVVGTAPGATLPQARAAPALASSASSSSSALPAAPAPASSSSFGACGKPKRDWGAEFAEIEAVFAGVWASIRFCHMADADLEAVRRAGDVPASLLDEAAALKLAMFEKLEVANRYNVKRLSELEGVDAPDVARVKDVKWPPFRFGVEVTGVVGPGSTGGGGGAGSGLDTGPGGEPVTTTSERTRFAGSDWCLDLKRYFNKADGQHFTAVYLRRKAPRPAMPVVGSPFFPAGPRAPAGVPSAAAVVGAGGGHMGAAPSPPPPPPPGSAPDSGASIGGGSGPTFLGIDISRALALVLSAGAPPPPPPPVAPPPPLPPSGGARRRGSSGGQGTGQASHDVTGAQRRVPAPSPPPVDMASVFEDRRDRTTLGFSIRLCGAPGSATSNSIAGRSVMGKAFGTETEASWGWESFLSSALVGPAGSSLRFVITLDML